MNTILAANPSLDPSDPEVCRDYFREFYFANSLDERAIQSARAELNFATVARDFRLIEDECTKSVIVPYGRADGLVNDVRRFVTREGLRSLQTYSVRIYPQAFLRLRQVGALDEVCEDLYAVTSVYAHLYDETFGLTVNGELTPDPAKLVI
jgi:hypothetical protein